MPTRISFKADSSFFEKVVIGAVGAASVRDYLQTLGHVIAELERGALKSKLWKEVKRKRVRIPDLVCTACGQRIESRAKTRPELSMSHSHTDDVRAWDFGMLPTDWIAFPICQPVARRDWMQGRLIAGHSYWHERKWIEWEPVGVINVFCVEDFRGRDSTPKRVKGVSEGSETQIFWPAYFAKLDSRVTYVDAMNIQYVPHDNTRKRSLRLARGVGHDSLEPAVAVGQEVRLHQVLAGTVLPLADGNLLCRGGLDEATTNAMLRSRERTVRYTGCRLSKLLRLASQEPVIRELAHDHAEDPYTRLEALSYLVTVGGEDARSHFGPILSHSADDQLRLESIVTLADTPAESAVEVLKSELADPSRPLFLRSASAWALGHFADSGAAAALVKSFADVDLRLRHEAVTALVDAGSSSLGVSLRGLAEGKSDIAAGCSEVLRRLGTAPVEALIDLAEHGQKPEWVVWLLASLPKSRVAPAILSWQTTRPELHFTMTVLWSFLESWISSTWERNPDPLI